MKINIKLLLITAAVVVVILAGFGLSFTSQPSFCQTCHEMKDDFKAWQSSAHKDASCVSCHIGSGIINLIEHKLSASKEIIAHVSGNFEEPINLDSDLSKELPSSHCKECHKSPGEVSNGRIVFTHNAHNKAGLNCSYCHNRVAHPNLKSYENRINMSTCVDCHKESNGPLNCKSCHPKDFKLRPTSHTEGDWIKMHGKGDTKACSNCHFNKERFCTDCHGVEMPHSKGWIGSHGKHLDNLNKCDTCHDRRGFCGSCHDQ